MESQVWSQISLEHAPNWFEEMLISLGAIVVKDSDSLMWHHRNDRTHHEMRYSNNKDLYLAILTTHASKARQERKWTPVTHLKFSI